MSTAPPKDQSMPTSSITANVAGVHPLPAPTQKEVKPCKCGSIVHKTARSKQCPLNKANKAAAAAAAAVAAAAATTPCSSHTIAPPADTAAAVAATPCSSRIAAPPAAAAAVAAAIPTATSIDPPRQCPNGHILVDCKWSVESCNQQFPDRVGAEVLLKWCDRCLCKINIGQQICTCRACNYDECFNQLKCKTKQCPNGHALTASVWSRESCKQQFPGRSGSITKTCDRCRKQIHFGVHHLNCSTCNYDECSKCGAKKKQVSKVTSSVTSSAPVQQTKRKADVGDEHRQTQKQKQQKFVAELGAGAGAGAGPGAGPVPSSGGSASGSHTTALPPPCDPNEEAAWQQAVTWLETKSSYHGNGNVAEIKGGYSLGRGGMLLIDGVDRSTDLLMDLYPGLWASGGQKTYPMTKSDIADRLKLLATTLAVKVKTSGSRGDILATFKHVLWDPAIPMALRQSVLMPLRATRGVHNKNW